MGIVLQNILEIPSFRGTFNGDREGVLDYLKVIGEDHSNRKTKDATDVRFQDHELPESSARKGGAVYELVTEITNSLGEYLGCNDMGWWNPWTIINKPGEQVYPHNHNDGPHDWSCVYWADVPEGSGMLEFYPFGLQSGSFPTMASPTKSGDYLIFPGWILHGVRQNCSKRNRVSMSMNMKAVWNEPPPQDQPMPNTRLPIGPIDY